MTRQMDYILGNSTVNKSVSRTCVILVLLLIIVVCCAVTGLLVYYLADRPQTPCAGPASQPNGDAGTSTPPPRPSPRCQDQCVFSLVETIPENLTYPSNETVHQATGPALIALLNNARHSIHVASFYWTLRFNDTQPSEPFDPSAQMGEDLFSTLSSIGRQGEVDIQIVQNLPSRTFPDLDTQILANQSLAEVRSMNFSRLLGSGVLHTKMWLVDRKHFYVGSANMDWRSLSQVKELGVLVQNCSCLADDMYNIFSIYWHLAKDDVTVPSRWPDTFSTNINKDSPLVLDSTGPVYLVSSPPRLCPEGRTKEIDAILTVISQAKQFVYVSVMEYMPLMLYTRPQRFWSVLDTALKTVAFDHRVEVRLLASKWRHSKSDMFVYLQSLLQFGQTTYTKIKLDVRIFEVPSSPAQARIPYARVNHNKVMVTDQHAYIGTSNWSGDYFVDTAGIAFILEQPETNTSSTSGLRQQLEDVFLRDWNSQYSHPLSDYTTS